MFYRKLNWKDPKKIEKKIPITYIYRSYIVDVYYLYNAILYRRGISKIYNDEGRRSKAAVVICRNLSATSDPEGNKDDFAWSRQLSLFIPHIFFLLYTLHAMLHRNFSSTHCRLTPGQQTATTVVPGDARATIAECGFYVPWKIGKKSGPWPCIELGLCRVISLR